MTQPQYREWCPFCGNVQEPLDVLARHLDTCEAHAEYRALAGMPDYAARIAELETQLQYQTRVNASLKEALDQALERLSDFSTLSLEVSTHWEQHLQTHADGPMAQKIAALTALAKLGQRT
jgi:hypothetical protein